MLYELFRIYNGIFPIIRIFQIVVFILTIGAIVYSFIRMKINKVKFKQVYKAYVIMGVIALIFGINIIHSFNIETRGNKQFDLFIPSYKNKNYYEQVKDYSLDGRRRVISSLYTGEYRPKVADFKQRIANYLETHNLSMNDRDIETLSMLAVDTGNGKHGMRSKKYKMSKNSKGTSSAICKDVFNIEKTCNFYLVY